MSAHQRMQNAGAAMRQLAEDVEAEALSLKQLPVEDAVRAYHRLRIAYDEMDEHRKKILEQLEIVSRGTIPEMFTDAGVKTMTLDVDGTNYRFTVAFRFNCSILEGMKDEAFDYLRSVGQGGIIQATVNAQTLSSYAKRMVQEEGRDLPDNLFRTGQMAYTSATKAR